MLGLPKGAVFLIPWTEDWEREFILEKERIQNKIGNYTVAVHHIGSTSVKHLSAKPIIDIAIEINDFNGGEFCISPLEEIGYSYKGTEILPDRHYFSKGEPRTHQIHMYQSGNKYLLEQLKFRDYLRKYDKARVEYEQLKLKLSKTNKNNKHRYAEEKTDFVKSILEKL
ncbi:hypothetical protein CIL05_20220 [Virgibacillus profundi]|uniref:GrpB family protein n=1 Tax=Virgibacillus profundi TaxID=2024555 RepID=A0A2A2I836_9BACI|nr:GrpB family protein [Virgibacillus profundi]PAV27742.1 hypothetical protein CIL05_20220 [Virgibacillus profundi]PXY51897.1 GrpB family protein [Virgibacillus profundi]